MKVLIDAGAVRAVPLYGPACLHLLLDVPHACWLGCLSGAAANLLCHPCDPALAPTPPCFRLLPQQNVSTANDSGNTALHWACLMGQEAVVRLLLEAGASAFALNK